MWRQQQPADSPEILKIIHMVAHCHKQIKKELVTSLHLHLHGSAALEDLPGANDHRQVMSAQSILCVRRVVVGIPSGAEDHIDGDAALQPLLAQRKLLEILQLISLGCTVHDRVPEDDIANRGVENCRFTRPAAAGVIDVLGVLEFPRIRLFVPEDSWEVVAFV